MANVKFDKEMMIKHHFWILSGVFLLLVLIPMALLGMSVSDNVTKAESKMKTSETAVKSLLSKTPKNAKWEAALREADEIVKKKKNQVWEQAWKAQEDMMTWPEALQREWGPKYRYMGQAIDQFDEEKFAQNYDSQIGEIFWMAQPATPTPEVVVQYKGGTDNWQKLLDIHTGFEKASKEDIWLAQEEIWVKRELMRIIRDANDAVARFKEVKPAAAASVDKKEDKPAAAAPLDKKEDKPVAVDTKDAKVAVAPDKDKKDAKPVLAKITQTGSDPNHRVFRNPYWELDLKLELDKRQYNLTGTIKNVGKRKQVLGGTSFLVYLDNTGSVPMRLEINDISTLAVGETQKFKKVSIPDTATVRELFRVEQVLTWKTAAVKRIEDVKLDHNSSRTMRKTLVKPRWVVEAPPDPAAAAGNQSAAGQQGSGPPEGMKGSGMGMGMGQGFGKGGGAQGGATDKTKNGLTLARYTDANEQVRHMPVGMVLIVEEEHIPEFLSAFASSKLRIQTLQAHWHHSREKIKPESKDSSADKNAPLANLPAMPGSGKSGIMGGMGAMGGVGMGRGGSLPPAGGGSGKGVGGQPASGGLSASAEEGEEAELNLVELAVYGLAALYERFPAASDKPAETASLPGK